MTVTPESQLASLVTSMAALQAAVATLQTNQNNYNTAMNTNLVGIANAVLKIPLTSTVDLSPVTTQLTAIQSTEAGMVAQLTDLQHQLET